MVHLSTTPITQRFSLDEYVDYMHDNLDVDDFDSLVDTSWAMRALANDRDFLLELYHQELKECIGGDSGNRFTPQSIRLYNNDDFYIRSNVWPKGGHHIEIEEQSLYSYALPHNHNFSFCSVGYFGPGYHTDLFRLEDFQVQGYVGEKVALSDPRRENLGPGTVMVYEAFRDIHTQHSPAEVSISLNLICRSKAIEDAPQFLFDTEDETILGSVGTAIQTRLFIIDLLRHVQNDESVDLLSSLAKRNDCARTRALALNILEETQPAEHERLLSLVPNHIRHLAKRPLAIGDEVRRCGLHYATKQRAAMEILA